MSGSIQPGKILLPLPIATAFQPPPTNWKPPRLKLKTSARDRPGSLIASLEEHYARGPAISAAQRADSLAAGTAERSFA
jgi:hypothetical protein